MKSLNFRDYVKSLVTHVPCNIFKADFRIYQILEVWESNVPAKYWFRFQENNNIKIPTDEVASSTAGVKVGGVPLLQSMPREVSMSERISNRAELLFLISLNTSGVTARSLASFVSRICNPGWIHVHDYNKVHAIESNCLNLTQDFEWICIPLC